MSSKDTLEQSAKPRQLGELISSYCFPICFRWNNCYIMYSEKRSFAEPFKVLSFSRYWNPWKRICHPLWNLFCLSRTFFQSSLGAPHANRKLFHQRAGLKYHQKKILFRCKQFISLSNTSLFYYPFILYKMIITL